MKKVVLSAVGSFVFTLALFGQLFTDSFALRVPFGACSIDTTIYAGIDGVMYTNILVGEKGEVEFIYTRIPIRAANRLALREDFLVIENESYRIKVIPHSDKYEIMPRELIEGETPLYADDRYEIQSVLGFWRIIDSQSRETVLQSNVKMYIISMAIVLGLILSYGLLFVYLVKNDRGD